MPLTPFKQRLDRVLRANESNTPYVLAWAGTAASGWTFGVPQWPVSSRTT